MQKLETKFRKRVEKFLNSLPKCVHFSIQQKAICGDPDKIICLNGYFIGLEIKKDEAGLKEKRFRLQAHVLSKITCSGGFGLVTYPGNWAKTQELLLELSKMESKTA